MVCIYMTPALGAKHGLKYFLVRALLALRLDRLGWLVMEYGFNEYWIIIAQKARKEGDNEGVQWDDTPSEYLSSNGTCP